MAAEGSGKRKGKDQLPTFGDDQFINDFIEKVRKERSDVVYHLNHHELTDAPAEALRTQIFNLSLLEQDLKDTLMIPTGQSLLTHTMKALTASAIAGCGAAVGAAVKTKVLSIVVFILLMAVAILVYLLWDALCCIATRNSYLKGCKSNFKHIRHRIKQARRYGSYRHSRQWEINSAFSGDRSALKFWIDNFGRDITRVPVERFENVLISHLKSSAKALDAVEKADKAAKKGESKTLKKHAVDGYLAKFNVTENMILELIDVCLREDTTLNNKQFFVIPMRFRSLLVTLGPFERILLNLLDLVDSNSTSGFKEWFLPMTLSKAELYDIGQKYRDTQIQFMSFFIHPAPMRGHFDEHAFRLVRYARSATKFVDDFIYNSRFGYHVTLNESELAKVFRRELRIEQAVKRVTGLEEKVVLEVIMEYITVAPPVFESIGDLVYYYREQDKLRQPVSFLKNIMAITGDDEVPR